MGAAFAYGKEGEGALLVIRLLVGRWLAEDDAPSGVSYLFARHLELNLLHFAQYRGGGEFAIGIEGRDEPARHQVEHPSLHIRQVLRMHTRGDDGVVVGHL